MSEFDDEIAKLKAALKGAPAPDSSAKQAAFDIAEENFKSLQERGELTRPTQTAPETGGVLKGLIEMFTRKSLKPLLLTTSSLVVIGVGLLVVQNRELQDQTLVEQMPDLVKAAPDVARHTDNSNLNELAEIATLPVPAGAAAPEPQLESAPDQVQNAQTSSTAADAIQMAPARPVSKRAQPANAGLETRRAKSADLQGMQLSASGDATRPIPTPPDMAPVEHPNRDRFANEAPNPLKVTIEEPVSTFSIDVDTASYAWVRRSLQNGQLPDPASVRIEEMVNYFPYDYTAPDGNIPFATTVTVTETPWNTNTQLVHIGIQGEMPEVEDRPPLNLVFLIDTSGSMNSADKLPLLIQSFRLMLSELRPQDQVAIVTYAGSAGMVLAPTFASDTNAINTALANLRAGGSTAGEAGLQQAYSVAEQMSEEGEIGRVILATDGDFNVGQSSDAAMKTLIEQKRDSGTYLSVLGFGRGNINDTLMQTLAQNGNGQAAYIDTLSEARKVLVDQLTGALFPIAGDVKVQVEFNPAQVAEYRLIGYETRALKREDFNNDKVDAGDIGAGHTVTALYEVTPVGSPAVLNEPLRYGEAATAGANNAELGFLRLRYKEPGESQSQLIETAIAPTVENAPKEAGFAIAIAGFAQLLRDASYLGDWSYSDAIDLANQTKGPDSFGYRAEAITLMRLAESLSGNR